MTTGDRIGASAMFWRYWAASVINNTGTGITVVALPLIAVVTLHVSNFEVGLLTAASYAATVLVGLPAGVIVQRFALRSLQVGLDVFRAVTMLSVPLAAWWGVLSLPFLLLVAFVVGLATNLHAVANLTYFPQVVPKEEMTARNSLLSGTYSATQMTGPALGGVLVQTIGAVASILVDALSYLVSAVLMRQIPVSGQATASRPQDGFVRQIVEGLRFVFRHPVMRPSVLAATAVNFANGAILATTPIFLIRTLQMPAGSVGFAMALDGAGALLGAAVTARLVARFGSARALLLATTLGAVLGLAMPLAAGPASLVIFGIGMAGLAAGVVVLSVITRTHRQTVSPPEVIARVMASVRFISWSAIPVGALVGGAVAQVRDPRLALVVAAFAAFGAPLAAVASRIRKLREMAQDDTDAVEQTPARRDGVA